MGYPFGYGNPWTKLYKNDESMKIKVFNDEVQAVLIDNHYEQEVFAEGESWENGDVPQLTYAELICVMCGFVNDERIETVMVLTNQGAMYSADVSKETGAFALMYTSGRIIRTITEEVLLMYEGYINAPYTLVQGYDKDGNLIDTFDVRDIDDPYITEIYNPHVAEWFPKSDIPGANQGFKSLGWADLETGEITYYEEEE